MKKLWLGIFLLSFCLHTQVLGSSDRVTGSWFAHEKGLDAVVVKLYRRDAKIYGVVTRTFGDYPDYCTECKGSAHNQKIIGMEILDGLTYRGSKWEGKVFYPAKGTWHECWIWRKGARLMVRVCTNGKCQILSRRRYTLSN